MKRTVIALTTAGLLLVPASGAWAHAEASHLTPKPGSSVKRSTSRVSLRFSEAVVAGRIKVTDGQGRTVSRGSKLIKGKTRLRASLDLHKGRFTVRATWVADDGDDQSKIWHFTSG